MDALWLILVVLAYMSLGDIPDRLNTLGKVTVGAHLTLIAIGVAGFLVSVTT